MILCLPPAKNSGLHNILQLEALCVFLDMHAHKAHAHPWYYRLAIDLLKFKSGFFSPEADHQGEYNIILVDLLSSSTCDMHLKGGCV